MRFTVIALAAAGLAGCASQTAVPVAKGPATAVPVAMTPVKAESCVQLQNIRESRVIDDKTIDFIMRDGRVLRNTLPYACPTLGFEKAFSYSTSLSQLCSVDIITVIQQGGGIRRGASCGLGQFVPYTAPPK